LCGLYWGGTAHWFKRLVDLIVATILSQLVITMLMVLAAAALDNGPLSVSGSVSTDMTTLFLAAAFLILGSLALPMALKHVPAATEHAATAASQISGPGRITYMGSRIAGTTRMMGRSGGSQQAIVRQAGAAPGPVGVAASAGVGVATTAARAGAEGAGGAANAGADNERPSGSRSHGPGWGAGSPGPAKGAGDGAVGPAAAGQGGGLGSGAAGSSSRSTPPTRDTRGGAGQSATGPGSAGGRRD